MKKLIALVSLVLSVSAFAETPYIDGLNIFEEVSRSCRPKCIYNNCIPGMENCRPVTCSSVCE